MTVENSKRTNRRALITGASKGLGLEIAMTLARDGYDLALADKKLSRLDKVLEKPELSEIKAIPVEIELLSEDSIRSGFNAAIEGLGGLDVLVNNAGTTLLKAAINVTWEEWDAVMDVNLKGQYFLACLLADHCISQKRDGSIINIASTHGLTGLADRSVYGISKGGMIQMSRMLAIEWATSNIRINTVAPSTVLTDSRKEMLKDPNIRKKMLERIPTGEFPMPEDIAEGVRYLASAQAKSVTGQTLAIDGGLTAA
ncbi:MAG: 2-deoxy-D-gluconate 3-dehydrogenase [Rhodospirillaceae bacterium]|nr:2-deoxy-D-gluconate 3-dehydrogenase [Rhodospirillaceae bacterium]|tara:strand:- start:357 stop:1124 length:768 start_codon:yes stop_codon:yes gene_type:complete